MNLRVLYLILYICAAACFFAYAINGGPGKRPNLLGLGVFFWSLVPIIETAHNL